MISVTNHKILSEVGLSMCLLVVVLSIAVLVGWVLDIQALKTVFPGLVSMKANTAISLLLCGIAMTLLFLDKDGKISRVCIMVLSVIVIVIGAVTLSEDFFGWDLGIDQWIFRDVLSAEDLSIPGRMGTSSAYCCVLLGLALLAATQPIFMTLRWPILVTASATVLMVSGLTFLSHIFYVIFGMEFWDNSGMAIHVAAGCMALSASLLIFIVTEYRLGWLLDRLTTVVFAIGIVVLLVTAARSFNLTTMLQENKNWVTHTQEVLKELNGVAFGLVDLESGQRGYIITGDDKLIQNREQMKDEVQTHIAKLYSLTADNIHQQRRLDQLKPLVAQRNDWGDQTIMARTQQGFPKAQQMIATQKGIVLTGAINILLTDMQQEEGNLLVTRNQKSNATSTRTFMLMPLQVFISLTILYFGLFLLNASIITRRKTEAALASNQAQLQATFDNMVEAVVVLDRDRNIIQSNSAAIKLLGLSDQNMSHNAILATYELFLSNGELLPQEEWPSSRALRGEFMHNFELGILNRNTGEITNVEITTAPIKDASDQAIQFIVSYHNITERKKLETTRAQLDAIVQSSADAIIGKDLNSIVTSWNAAAERMFGYAANKMLGQSILCLIPPDRQAEESLIISKIKNGETLENFETERITKDGKLINVSVTASPIRDADNNIIGVSKIVRDITEQKQLEQQFRQSQKMEAVGQLTGGVAHDFNNLLGIIIGNLDLIEEQIAGNEEVMDSVQTAQKAAARGADLTKRLLAFSRLQQLNPTSTSLENSIKNIMEMASRTIGPEIKITTKLDDSVPPVFVDTAGLESALLNLVVNARDAMPKGGSITISTQSAYLDEHFLLARDKDVKPGHYAHIMVSDTGHGMSAEVLAKVFEPFFTTKPRGKGTGLGLSMVYGFVKQSGGLVRIYSEVDHGTTMSLYLPLAEGVTLPTKKIAQSVFKDKAHGTILVVDDEADLLKVAVKFLEKIGFTVLQAIDGPSALEILGSKAKIDLLLTDIIMPGGINGVELAAKARNLKPNIKIVYSSGFPSEALSERSGTIIDGPLLNKPYNRKVFIETIRSVMEQ